MTADVPLLLPEAPRLTQDCARHMLIGSGGLCHSTVNIASLAKCMLLSMWSIIWQHMLRFRQAVQPLQELG